MATQQDIQNLIDQINNLLPTSQRLTRTAAEFEQFYQGAANAAAALNGQLDSILDSLSQAAATVADLDATYRNISRQIKDQLDKLIQQGNLTTAQLKAARDRVSLNKSLLQDAQGLTRLSKDQLELIVKVYEKSGLTATLSRETVEYAKKRLAEEKQIERQLQQQQMLYNAISKIPIAGRLFDQNAAKKAYDLEMESSRIADKKQRHTEAMAAGLKAGFNEMSLLTGSAAILLEMFGKIKQAVFAMDEGIASLAKNMNVTYSEARVVYKDFVDIGKASGDFALRGSTLAKTLGEINQSLGSTVYLSQQEVKFMTELREKAALTSEEIATINKFTKATGQDQKTFTDDFLKSVKLAGQRRGIVINEKQALQDVLKISKDIVASFGMSAQKLADAEAAAKKVGISMDKLNSIASTLLDFEQSISAEIEAEILTGKQLNLEMARVYAINNDIAGLAREIEKNYGSIAEFSQMNRLQQEAAAKAVGLSREELAASLLEAQALAGVSGEDAENRKRALDLLIKQYGVSEAQRILDKEGVDKIMEQYSIQQKFNAAVEKFQELFAKIAEGPLMAMLSGFADLLSNTWAVHAAMMALGAVAGVMVGAAIAIALAMNAAFGGVIGVIAATAAIGAGITGLMSIVADVSTRDEPQQVGDMSYDPNGGPIVAIPQKGAKYQLAKEDGMIVGPVTDNKPQKQPTQTVVQQTPNIVLTMDYQRLTGRASTTTYDIGTANDILT